MNSKQNWTTISCQVENSDEETCSYLLFSLGALGLEIRSNNDNEQLIVASFDTSTITKEKIEEFQSLLSNGKLQRAMDTLKIDAVEKEDWLSNWKKHFEPFKIGDSFLICPPWATKKLKDEDLVSRKKIVIDPGMAFGTGLHATTSYCLKATEKHLIGPEILDVGTGSGILSIAVLLLMPDAHITAIDFDENSFDNAKHNFELNHTNSKIKLKQLTLEEFERTNHKQFDTIFSNLTAEVIYDCLPIFNKILANGGNLILAGIIEERLPLIENAVSKYPFKLIDKGIESGWVGLIFNKESRCPT